MLKEYLKMLLFLIDNAREHFLAFLREIIQRIKRIKTKTVMVIMIFLWLYACFSNITYDDVSCYNIESDDDLPPIQNHRLLNAANHIYFHETSCIGILHPRQACVVESAARLHPKWQINVVFSAPMNMSSRAKLNPFQEFPNVKFWRVNILHYLKNTPLEYLVTEHYIENSFYAISHTSDVLRSATLNNWAGVYLDLDALLVKSLDGLAPNFATRENSHSASFGILALSSDNIGRSVAKEVYREMAASFNGRVFDNNGPGVITRVLQRRCNTKDSSQMSSRTCKGFEVYGPSYFYPIPWTEGHKYFEPGNLQNNFSYGYHFWNTYTKTLKVGNYSTIAELAKQYCPFTYQLYMDQFGFSEKSTIDVFKYYDMNPEAIVTVVEEQE